MSHSMEIAPHNTNLSEEIIQLKVESPPNIDDDGGTILSIRLCTAPKWKTALRYISYVCTGFIMYLLNLWNPSLFVSMSLSDASIKNAKKVVVYGADKNIEVVPLLNEKISNQNLKVFTYRLLKYYFDETSEIFRPCSFHIERFTTNEIHEKFGRGPEDTVVREHTLFFGKNATDIPEKSWLTLLVYEILTPFYLFQIYSFIVWYFDEYAVYAAIILVFSAISIGSALYENISTTDKLRKMSYYEIPVTVYRKAEGNEEAQKLRINSSELIPGDLMEVPEGVMMPCDAIILNGSCIVNESMLTGESIPVLKNALPYNDNLYNSREDKQYTIYAGTKCIQSRYYQENAVLALVIATGFSTVKGELVRTMMFPKPTDFRFYSDSFKFVSILAVIALAGFAVDLPAWLRSEDKDEVVETIIIKASELITVTVPPALPTCLQIGISIALSKLKKKSIYSIVPSKINEAGRINVMCFDKTGTLTEEGLELMGVRPILFDKNLKKLDFTKLVKDVQKLTITMSEEEKEEELENYISLNPPGKTSVYKQTRMFPSEQMLEIMASCHSLTIVNNRMIGDPLDLKMFRSTHWVLEENDQEKYDTLVLSVVKPQPKSPEISQEKAGSSDSLDVGEIEIGLIRRFEFSSKLQRMSVIVKNLQEAGFKIHIKGSPEKIRELCRPESIPENFHRMLEKYAQHGYRVIACATRALGNNYRKIMGATREDLEKDFTFVGFLIMENRLKPITTDIIDLLHAADVKTVMVTGDNVLTALSVARQCDIIDQNKRIFLGDLSEKKVDGKDVLHWKDFNFSERVLNKNLELEVDGNASSRSSVILSENLEQPMGEDLERHGRKSSLEESLLPQHDSRGNRRDFIVTSKTKELPLPFFNARDQGEYCLAITGRAFSFILKEAEVNQDPEYQYMLQKVLRKCLVFARMLPDEKASMVQHLMSIPKNVVGMCGDGANDIAALKTANVGISLSDAEASIAAPFTSNVKDISCVPTILKEGRAALTTSYQEFKFMALYSLIQFVGVTILYANLIDFTTWQYYHVDIVIVLTLSATMALSKTSEELTKAKPTGRLISVYILTSVIGQIVIQISFQIATYFLLKSQPWYRSDQCKGNFDSGDACFENSSLYIVSIFQYCVVALVFSEGRPFKGAFYTNLWFTGLLVILIILNMLVTYNPFDWAFMYDQMNWATEVAFEISWRNILMLIIVINSISTVVWEKVVVQHLSAAWRNHQESRQKNLESLKSYYRPPSVNVTNTMAL